MQLGVCVMDVYAPRAESCHKALFAPQRCVALPLAVGQSAAPRVRADCWGRVGCGSEVGPAGIFVLPCNFCQISHCDVVACSRRVHHFHHSPELWARICTDRVPHSCECNACEETPILCSCIRRHFFRTTSIFRRRVEKRCGNGLWTGSGSFSSKPRSKNRTSQRQTKFFVVCVHPQARDTHEMTRLTRIYQSGLCRPEERARK